MTEYSTAMSLLFVIDQNKKYTARNIPAHTALYYTLYSHLVKFLPHPRKWDIVKRSAAG